MAPRALPPAWPAGHPPAPPTDRAPGLRGRAPQAAGAGALSAGPALRETRLPSCSPQPTSSGRDAAGQTDLESHSLVQTPPPPALFGPAAAAPASRRARIPAPPPPTGATTHQLHQHRLRRLLAPTLLDYALLGAEKARRCPARRRPAGSSPRRAGSPGGQPPLQWRPAAGTGGEMKRKWQERLKKVEERASHYERNPLPTVYRPRLSKPSMPSSIWKIFSRQAEAFNYVKTCKEDVHVFALEKNTQNGQRFYLVTTYKELWFYYTKGYKTSLMHCYEVIPEKDACKLYFDLEFYKPANPGADGKSMVMKLIELVSQKLKELYGVNCSSKDVLNLDSSTDEKFSRHLIFLPQNTVFKDNTHVGNFVRTILQPAIRLMESKAAVISTEEAGHVFQCSAGVGLDGSLPNLTAVEDASKDWPAIAHKTEDVEMSHQGENLDFSFLIVNDKEGNNQLFVDLGVYTKNRNFRMYKSSKAGKNVILKIAEDNNFIPNCEKDVSLEEAYFLSSLICNIGASDDIKVLSSGFSEKERKMSAFLNSKTTGRSRDPMEGYQGSPYPEIDNFVRSLVNKDGLQGGIRQWSYFSLKELIIYDISGYRWCENIGRAHKSNNIMILVDLKNEVWYQKCHDPVCREQNFKSQSFPLPPGICLPSLFKEEEESTHTDDRGHTEGKVNPHSNVSDLSKSSVAPENSWTQDLLLSDSEWENTSDDACFLEAAEDVELAEAADDSLNYAMEEISDEVLLEALRREDTYTKEGS